jgi:hypothetical protein
VPVHKLAPIKITMPDAKNTKIALYFFKMSLATITEQIIVKAIDKNPVIITPLLINFMNHFILQQN